MGMSSRKRTPQWCGGAVAWLVLCAAAFAGDNFDEATEIFGPQGSAFDNNESATKELGEPNHGGVDGGHSLWWRWTPPISQWTYTDSSSNGFPTAIAIYTGDFLASLTVVAQDSTIAAPQPYLVKAGTTYHIAVDSASTQTGNIGLFWGQIVPPNDNFSAGTPISGANGTITGSITGATPEPDEPRELNGEPRATIWYDWTAPFSGNFQIDTHGSDFNTVLSAFIGSSVSSLSIVGQNNDTSSTVTSEMVLQAAAGTVYHIRVDSYFDSVGLVLLNWSPAPASPANDNFENAATIMGDSGAQSVENSSATTQLGDPLVYGHSLWWTWTPTETKWFRFASSGSTHTFVRVFTGTNVFDVADVTAGAPPRNECSFVAMAGQQYYIVADSQVGTNITLSWADINPPNDDFADAYPIYGGSGTTHGVTIDMTAETGEPGLANGAASEKSIWYAWTAPATGTFRFDTYGSDFDTELGIYIGDSVNGLTRIAWNDDSIGFQSQSNVPAQEGTTYYIQVDGFPGSAGVVTLNWNPQDPVPPNDDFANAEFVDVINGNNEVTGIVTIVNATNHAATGEIGEPDFPSDTGGTSVWYRVTPSQYGTLTVDVVSGDIYSITGVLRGHALADLQLLGYDAYEFPGQDSHVTVTLNKDMDHFVKIDGGSFAKTGFFQAKFTFVPSAGPPQGDVNGDGAITAEDAALAWRCYIEGSCPGGADPAAADVCFDTVITPQDAQSIFNLYLGLPGECAP